MNERSASSYLSSVLPNNLYVKGFNKKVGDVYLFFVKDKKYKDDDFVLPENYGVKENGEILDMDDVLKYLDEIEIG